MTKWFLSALVFLIFFENCKNSENESDNEKKTIKVKPVKPKFTNKVNFHSSRPKLIKKREIKKPQKPTAMDFTEDFKLFMKIIACDSSLGNLPKSDKEIINNHCKKIEKAVAIFRKNYIIPGRKFFTRNIKGPIPTKIVYPFGGGDLFSPLLVYPNAQEITSISLEHPGDPRRLRYLHGETLKLQLQKIRKYIIRFFYIHDHASINLKKLEKGSIPGQIALFATALTVFKMHPVSVKFFKLGPEGEIIYFSKKDVAELKKTVAPKKKRTWVDTDFSVVFTNYEIKFRPRVGGQVIIHRHFAHNLHNRNFKQSHLIKHLKLKNRISAITKAASYLLWNRGFSVIRNYLLSHMELMISDSTGIPPLFVKKAGFSQITFGIFKGAYLNGVKFHNLSFVDLWDKSPVRSLRFRFGYPDNSKHNHLVITRKIAKKSKP